MTLRNSNLVRAKDLTQEQKKELNIEATEGLVAIETHNSEYERKAVVLKHGLVRYVLEGE
ncbi:hypothetical protein HOK51_03820 [Candidatus Woesearchaeota archaeon]|jgi:hypothetical protein|nr:hypothetical protein [Candidatus Woesearchaeota archaeon]MBT7368315.1 hypothetical protein [Candidatus Woesearchaeota archaeon]